MVKKDTVHSFANGIHSTKREREIRQATTNTSPWKSLLEKKNQNKIYISQSKHPLQRLSLPFTVASRASSLLFGTQFVDVTRRACDTYESAFQVQTVSRVDSMKKVVPLYLDHLGSFYEVFPIIVVFLDTRCYSENVGIKDDVIWIHLNFVN